MESRFVFLAFLLCITGSIYSQDKFKVIRNTYLKINPDQYADNITQIPQGTIVTKKSNTDYPYILLSFNDEIGYVSKIDLETFNAGSESSIESLPLEEEEETKKEEFKETETSVDELFKTKLDIQKEKKKPSLIPLNFLPNLKWNNNYLWVLSIIPLIFMVFIINRFIKSKRTNNNNFQSFMGNDFSSLPPIPLETSSKLDSDNEYSEPLKIQRWDNSAGKD